MHCSDGYVPPKWTEETSHNKKINDVLYSLFSLAFDDTEWAWDRDDVNHDHCGYLSLDDADNIYDCIEYVLDVIADTFRIYIYYPLFDGGKEKWGNWVHPTHYNHELNEMYDGLNFWDDEEPDEFGEVHPHRTYLDGDDWKQLVETTKIDRTAYGLSSTLKGTIVPSTDGN